MGCALTLKYESEIPQVFHALQSGIFEELQIADRPKKCPSIPTPERKHKELMGHASIVTTMRYIHATDQGKGGAIVMLSEYRQRHCRKFVAKEKRQTVQPAASR